MHRRSTPRLLAMLVGLSLAMLAMPPAATACTCVGLTMAGVRGDPEFAVFTGIVEPADARGHPVAITRWFQGGDREPRAWLHAGSFGDGGGDCTVPGLPRGTEWIFVAARWEGRYSAGACSPHAALDSVDGQAMLAEAIRLFGEGRPPPTAPPAPGPTVSPAPSATPAAPLSMVETVVPIAVAIFGLAVLVGIVGALRRTRPRSD